MASDYPKELWARLREVWESSPKISWQKLADQVKAELGCDVPHFTNIRRRSIAEKWEKHIKITAKSTAKKLNKDMKDLAKQASAIKENQTDDSKQESTAKNDAKYALNVAEKQSNNSAKAKTVNSQLTAAIVIRNNRNRSSDLGNLIGDTIDSLLHVRDEAIALTNPNEDEIRLLDRKMNLVAGVVELTEKISRSAERVAKIDAVFWGLGIDDLKDLAEVQSRRSAVIESAKGRLEAAKAKMAADKRAAFERKVAMVEAGDMDVVEEVE